MAAATFTEVYKWTVARTSSFMVVGVFTGPTSYPNTGGTVGVPLPASFFGLNAFADTSDAQLQVAPAMGPVWVVSGVGLTDYAFIDPTTGNLRLLVGTTGVEVANGVDVSASKYLLVVWGR